MFGMNNKMKNIWLKDKDGMTCCFDPHEVCGMFKDGKAIVVMFKNGERVALNFDDNQQMQTVFENWRDR